MTLRSHMASALPSLTLSVLALAITSGCQRDAENAGGEAITPASHSTAAPAKQSASLEDRAAELWSARAAEDWMRVFAFENTAAAQQSTPEEFAAWASANEPFVVKSYQIEDVVTEETLGWVGVTVTSSLRKFESAPPQTLHRWEKWRLHEGAWYPVPRNELEYYPAAPAQRDLDDEGELRDRAATAWEARVAADWKKVFDLIDPAERKGQSVEGYAAAADTVNFISYRIRWVEALNGRGRVQLEITQKLNDPSMTKLPASTVVVEEVWIERNGAWYMEL